MSDVTTGRPQYFRAEEDGNIWRDTGNGIEWWSFEAGKWRESCHHMGSLHASYTITPLSEGQLPASDSLEQITAENAALREEKQERENQLSIQIGVNEKMRDRIDTLRETNAGLVEALDTLTAVIGLTAIANNKAAMQEAFNKARAALDAAKGGER